MEREHRLSGSTAGSTYRLGRSEKISLIVLSLTLFSIVAIAWAGAISNYTARQQVANDGNQPSNGKDPNSQSEPIYLGLFKPSDSYAQWIMALLSLAATGVSWRAVILVRDQLIETRNAIYETRRIGEAQVRAYIGSPRVDARLETENGTRWFRIDAYVQNSGNSPALLPSISCYVAKGEDILNLKHALLERDIAAGERDFQLIDQGHPADSNLASYLHRGGELIFAGTIQYHTVFGGLKKTTFRFRLERHEPGDGPFKVSVDHTLSDGTEVEQRRD